MYTTTSFIKIDEAWLIILDLSILPMLSVFKVCAPRRSDCGTAGETKAVHPSRATLATDAARYVTEVARHADRLRIARHTP